MINNWSGKEWQNWLLANSSGTALATFTTYLGSQIKAEANVTFDYLEQGSFAAYNKTNAPLDINVTLAKDGTPSELQQAITVLERLRTTTELISFVTPLKEHRNMTLDKYDYAFNEGQALTTLVVNIHLVEIREQNNQYTDVAINVAPISTTDATNPSDESTINRGNTNSTEVEETAPASSVLADLEDLIYGEGDGA